MKPQVKFIWRPEDVKAGMIVCRAHRGKGRWKPEPWAAKWTYKVAFDQRDDNQYCLVAMTDGMVCATGRTKELMAACFNDDDMIPMPYNWWLRMVKYLQPQTNPKL